MKIIIDEKTCIKHGLKPEELYIILAVKNSRNYEDTINNMINRKILINIEGKLKIAQKWNETADGIIYDSSSRIMDEESLLELAKQMRECFPAGKIHGTPYYYRCNNAEVVRKLKKFFIQYGDKYSNEQIIDATKRFVASFNGNYRYLPLIKYFISKLKPVQEEDGTVHNVEFSPLADFLENSDEDNVVSANADDWMMNSRN